MQGTQPWQGGGSKTKSNIWLYGCLAIAGMLILGMGGCFVLVLGIGVFGADSDSQPAASVAAPASGGEAPKSTSPPKAVKQTVRSRQTLFALMDDGSVYYSGIKPGSKFGLFAQVVAYQHHPAVVDGLAKITQIAPGIVAACALDHAGAVYCWGDNAMGQLATGSKGGVHLKPVMVAGLGKVRQISGQGFAFCALAEAGTVKCWGATLSDEAENFTRKAVVTATEVRDLTGVKKVAVGGGHACAVLNDASVRCWGSNYAGALGDGTEVTSSTPVVARGVADAIDVAAGGSHSCALLKSGRVWCWGAAGGVGVSGKASQLIPVDVGLEGVEQLDAVEDFSCVKLKAGKISCWGSIAPLAASTETPQVVAGLDQVQDLKAGVALQTDGKVVIWGPPLVGYPGFNEKRMSYCPPSLVQW